MALSPRSSPAAPAPPPPPADVVRQDWYFRESLAAIRDWEAILAEWEKATPKDRRTPLLPVPADGAEIEWPNPIPRTLLCDGGQDPRVRVRLAAGKFEVLRETARETVAPGRAIVGYKHPGGGAKDRWYHAYQRRFDELTVFEPVAAPLALKLASPYDLRRGANELAVEVRNVSDKPLKVALRLTFHGREPEAGKQEIRNPQSTTRNGVNPQSAPGAPGRNPQWDLPPGAARTASFPVALDRQGGGLLILAVQAGGERFWLPLLTHVEDVSAVLDGIAKILSDHPDAAASARLADLRRRAAAWSEQSRTPWRAIYEDACALREELLLGRIGFEAMLFVKRKPFDSEQPFMDAHHLRNRPGGGIYRLSPVRPDGKVTPLVDSLGEGVYRDVCLHWDAGRFVFAFGNGSDKWDGSQSYHIYEAAPAAAAKPRRLTTGPKNDCEPFYLPGGQIGFTSDRSEHFVMCGGDRHSPTLFVMDADGSGVRQLSFNVFNDYNPCVLPDGRILYSRWEYNERSVTSLHTPFTMNPDGTMVEVYYGNATIRPNVVMFPRPVPGSHKIMALFTAHHGQTHGPIGLIDTELGLDKMDPITVLTPHVPVTGERAEDSRHGWYTDPLPLSEDTYLCSFTPTVLPWLERSWAIYVGDRHGNLALVYRDPAISCAEPVPLVPGPRPAARPPAPPNTDALDAEATLLVLDAQVNLPGVPGGTARYLRIVEDVPRKGVTRGGVILTAGTRIFTVKRIFGTVPVEADGSAHFVVPANRNIYFEVLDADQLEVQRMRSVVCLKPGESRTCVGCHESRNTAPPNVRRPLAARRAPSRPAPPPWGTQIVSFLRDVQPVLNDQCVRCHTHDRAANRVILTDDLTDQFCVGYEELLPYIRYALSDIWDTPDDVYARPPYTYGSKASPLTAILAKGHYDVKLTDDQRLRLVNWIDANGVYYDRYEAVHPKRNVFLGDARKALEEVHARRCASCHGHGDGRRETWWLSLNRRDVKLSRPLLAPLARSAGGWGRCDDAKPVFPDTRDADYRYLLAALTAVREAIDQHPREDVLSLRGTAAQSQIVAIPPPPPPRPAPKDDLPKEGWTYLSDLKWQRAAAGWSRNNDKLPRRDRDAGDNPLLLGARRYRKGLGTHAPSEIVYDLGGRYGRFFAVVGGGEVKGTVVFQVFGDDKRLFDSGVMHGLGGTKTVDVPVAGVRQLRLVVTDAGDNYFSDMATWADARLLAAGQQPQATKGK